MTNFVRTSQQHSLFKKTSLMQQSQMKTKKHIRSNSFHDNLDTFCVVSSNQKNSTIIEKKNQLEQTPSSFLQNKANNYILRGNNQQNDSKVHYQCNQKPLAQQISLQFVQRPINRHKRAISFSQQTPPILNELFNSHIEKNNGQYSPPTKFHKMKKQYNNISIQLKKTATSDKEKLPAFLKNIISQKRNQQNMLDVPKLQFINFDSVCSSMHEKRWTAQDFQFGKKLGRGAYGNVYLVQQKRTHLILAIKKLSKKRIKQLQVQQNILRQIKIQSYLDHPNITKIFGFFDDQQYIYIIQQYLPGGDLEKSLVNKQKTNSQLQVSQLLLQICEALKIIHDEQVIHRDIKPQNIFIFQKVIKIGDFGCAIYSEDMRKTVIGTLQYISPEVLRSQTYHKNIDNWSVGILTYQLLYGFSPFKDEIIDLLSKGQKQRKFPQVQFPVTPIVSTEAKDFIKRLLTQDARKRMTMSQALKHQFLSRAYFIRTELRKRLYSAFKELTF